MNDRNIIREKREKHKSKNTIVLSDFRVKCKCVVCLEELLETTANILNNRHAEACILKDDTTETNFTLFEFEFDKENILNMQKNYDCFNC